MSDHDDVNRVDMKVQEAIEFRDISLNPVVELLQEMYYPVRTIRTGQSDGLRLYCQDGYIDLKVTKNP